MKKHFAMLRRPLSFILAVMMVLSCVNGAVFTAAAADYSVTARDILQYLAGKDSAESKIIAGYVTYNEAFDYDDPNAQIKSGNKVSVVEADGKYVITADTYTVDGNEWKPVGITVKYSGKEMEPSTTENGGKLVASVDMATVGKSYNVEVTYKLYINVEDDVVNAMNEILALAANLKADQGAQKNVADAESELKVLTNDMNLKDYLKLEEDWLESPLSIIEKMASDEGFVFTTKQPFENETYEVDVAIKMENETARQEVANLNGAEDVLAFIENGKVEVEGKKEYSPLYSLAKNNDGEILEYTYLQLKAIETGLNEMIASAKDILQANVNQFVADKKAEAKETINTNETLKEFIGEEFYFDTPSDLQNYIDSDEFEADLKAYVDKKFVEELSNKTEVKDLGLTINSRADLDNYYVDKDGMLTKVVDEKFVKELGDYTVLTDLGLTIGSRADLDAYITNKNGELTEVVDNYLVNQVKDKLEEYKEHLPDDLVIETRQDVADLYADKDQYIADAIEEERPEAEKKVYEDLAAEINEDEELVEYADQTFSGKDDILGYIETNKESSDPIKALAASKLEELVEDIDVQIEAEIDEALVPVNDMFASVKDLLDKWDDAYVEFTDKLGEIVTEWGNAYVEATNKVGEVVAEWDKAYVDAKDTEYYDTLINLPNDWQKIDGAAIPEVGASEVENMETMLETLRGYIRNGYKYLEGIGSDWYLLDQDYIKLSTVKENGAELDNLVAQANGTMPTVTNKVDSGVDVVYKHEVNTATVSVNADVVAYDEKGEQLELELPELSLSYSKNEAEAKTVSEILDAIAQDYEDSVKAELTAAYGDLDNAANYTVKWTAKQGDKVLAEDEKVLDDATFTLSIHAVEYTVTESWGEGVKLAFGQFYEKLPICTEENYEYVYEVELEGELAVDMYQGESFRVEGNTTVTQVKQPLSQYKKLNDLLVEAGLIDLDEEEAALIKAILQDASVLADSIRIRYPNAAGQDHTKLVTAESDKVTAVDYPSGLVGGTWIPVSALIQQIDGESTYTVKDPVNGVFYVDQNVDEGAYMSAAVTYVLDVLSVLDEVQKAQAEELLDLPKALIDAYNSDMAMLLYHCEDEKIENLKDKINATNINTIGILLEENEGAATSIAAYNEIKQHMNDHDGTIPMKTHLEKIAGWINSDNKDDQISAMVYYYLNAAELKASMKVMAENVPVMLKDPVVRDLMQKNGINFSIESINGYLGQVATAQESLNVLNSGVKVEKEAALKALMEKIHDAKTVELEVQDLPGVVNIYAPLLSVVNEGEYSQVIIQIGGQVFDKVYTGNAETKLSQAEVDELLAQIEQMKQDDKGADKVEFYEYDPIEITTNTTYGDLKKVELKSVAKEFTFDVPGAAATSISIENLTLELPESQKDGYKNIYTLYNGAGVKVASFEDGQERELTENQFVAFAREIDGKRGYIELVERDLVRASLEAFIQKATGCTLVETAEGYAVVLPLAADSSAMNAAMNFVQALSAFNSAYLVIDGEERAFYLDAQIRLQTLVDAFLNSGIESDVLAERIANKTDLSEYLVSTSMARAGGKLGIEVLSVPMKLFGGEDNCNPEVQLYVTLDQVSSEIKSAVKGYNAISDNVKVVMENGEARMHVTMPEKYPVYEAYMALMMLEEATFTNDKGETITASWRNIDQMNGALAFHYLFEDVIGSVVMDPNVTIDTYDNTIDILNTIAGKVTERQLSYLPETIYAFGADRSVEALYAKFAEYYGKGVSGLVYEGDQVYRNGVIPVDRLVDRMGLGDLSALIYEYNNENVEGLKVKVAADITNAPHYQGVVVDIRADGITSKVHMTDDVVASAANMSGAGAIMLLTDVNELVLDTKTVLDLNGNRVEKLIANGFVAVLDSSLGNGSVGEVVGNARVMGGKYDQADIDQYLAAGYDVENGEVRNKLYTITNVGDTLDIKIHVNKDNMAEFVGIEGAVKLAMEIVSDIAFNYYHSASLYFQIGEEKCMLYDFSLDNVLGTAADANRDNILSLIIDTMIGDEEKGYDGWINEPQFAKIVNEIVAQLTAFQTMDITGENPIFSMNTFFAKWDVEYGHTERVGYEDGYLDFSIGSDNTKEINKKVNFYLDIDSSIADSVLSFLADIVYVNDLTLTLDHINYNDAGDFVTNGSYGGNVTIDLRVREENDDIRYMNTIMAILANNSAEQDKWVDAINSKDYLCLYNLFNQVTLDEMLEAIAAVGSIDADILDGLYADLKEVGKADKQILIDMYNIALDSVTLDRAAINELYVQAKAAAPENAEMVKELLKALTQGSEAVKALYDDLKTVYATDKEVALKLVEVLRVCVNIDRAQVKSFGAEVKAVAGDNLDALKACYNAFCYGRTSNLAEMAKDLGITEEIENRFNIFAEALSYAMKAALKVADHYGLDPAFLQRTMGSFEGAKGVYDIRSTRTMDADVSIRGFSLTSSFSTDDLALVLNLFPADLGGHVLTHVEAKKPTCLETGNIEHWFCSICELYFADAEGKVELSEDEVFLDKTAHTLIHVAAKDATCAEDGNSEYWYCDVCGKYFSDAEGKNEIDAASVVIKAAHTLIHVAAKDATCTEDGNIEYWYCDVCGKYFSDAEGKTEIDAASVVRKAAHTLTHFAAKPADCDDAGNIEYWQCSVCGKYFTDSEGKNEVTNVTIAPLGHTSKVVTGKAATCTETGLTDGVVCSVCGTVITAQTEIPALGHAYGKWFSISESQHKRVCANDKNHFEIEDHIWGNDNICDECGYEKGTDVLHKHTPGKIVIENKIEATCTKEGSYDEVVYCTECGEELSRVNKTIDKLEHTPADAAIENKVEATCTKEGSYDEVVYCSVCKTELSRTTKVLEKVAHIPADAVIENKVEATCAKEGSYDEVVYCSVCKTELSRTTKVLEKAAHTPAEAVIKNKVEATCVKEGSYDEVVYCSVCKTELSRTAKVIEKTAHTPAKPVTENAVSATCTSDGKYDVVVYCSVCDVELSREIKVVPMTGHTPGEITYENKVPATCTEDGSHDEVVYCKVCMIELSRETVVDKAFGHQESEWMVLRESNCFVKGEKGIICVHCGIVLKSEELPLGYHKHICAHDAENCDSLKAGLTDVPLNAWFHDHVDCIVYRGIMIGMSETLFEPQTTTTRAMVVQMLYRMECERQNVEEGELEYNYTGELADLTGNEWFAEAAMWANATGVLRGVLYADGTIKFDGNDPVTREQLVAFLYRYVGEFRGINTNKLADISNYVDHELVADWAYTAMQWAVGNGIIIGEGRSIRNSHGSTILVPLDDATRAEMATVFHRMLELVIEPAEAKN